MRQTSIDVYNQIKDEGLLGEVQFRVYDAIYRLGGMTQGETASIVGMDRNVASPRFAELERMGLIREVCQRSCRVTGRTCIEWDVTDKRPAPLEKPKKQDPIELIHALETRLEAVERFVSAQPKQVEMFQIMKGH